MAAAIAAVQFEADGPRPLAGQDFIGSQARFRIVDVGDYHELIGFRLAKKFIDGVAKDGIQLKARARVTVRTKSEQQVRLLSPCTGYQSCNEALLHFGLGDDVVRRGRRRALDVRKPQRPGKNRDGKDQARHGANR